MADGYDVLTPVEQSYWNIYTRLRELSDWDGFTDEQRAVKDAARNWLENQRKAIWRIANTSGGWDKLDRRARYEQLKDESLNSGSCRLLCQLPTSGCTAQEKAAISEREMWWRVASVDDQTKDWRQANADWLVARRKQVYSLAEDEGWDEAERKLRYRNLAIATKFGDAYDVWAKTHDIETGREKQTERSYAQVFVANCRKHLGTSEHPAGSNKGSPQPSGWQKRVIGADGFAWCACFVTCMAWDSGAEGSSSAGVQVIVDMARRGQGMFRGYTTDPSRVRAGDFAIISCTSCHIGGVIDDDDPYHTIEGNTSPGDEGSQFNGGTVAERHRKGAVVGWALVDR